MATVQLINGYVLLPHLANWDGKVDWGRTWQNEVAADLTGYETRQGLRAQAREDVAFIITAASLAELSELTARLDAASLSGLACAPFWGHGVSLAADVTEATVVLGDNLWNWQIGDFVFFLDTDLNFDVIAVTAVNAGTNTLTLAGNVSRTYMAATLAWPLIFGKFRMEKLMGLTTQKGDVKVTLMEMLAHHEPDIGVSPEPESGIGAMVEGGSFIVG